MRIPKPLLMDDAKASTSAEVFEKANKKPNVTPPVKSEKLPAEKKLTKELVLAKSKAGSLVEIKKIVIWGQRITDCGIVTEIPDLEVASMTANRISGLEHFGQCPNLRELYLRNNCIRELAEIYHLKDLPNLQILWLAGNPCTKHPRYRLSVIRNLEQLQMLDDDEVTPEERELCDSDGVPFDDPPMPPPPFDVEKLRPQEDRPLLPDDSASEPATSATESQAPASEASIPKEPQTPAVPSATEPVGDDPSAEKASDSESAAAASAVTGIPATGSSVTASDLSPATAISATETSATAIAATTTVTADTFGVEAATTVPASTVGLAAATATGPTPLPRYALAEVRTAVLRLIRLLDTESLQLVQQTVRSRLAASGDDSGVDSAANTAACSASLENL